LIEQKIENDKAELFYKYSIKTIKQIEKYNIWVCISVAILYIAYSYSDRHPVALCIGH